MSELHEPLPPVDNQIRTRAKKRAQDKAFAEYRSLTKELELLSASTPTEEANDVISRHLTRSAALYPKIHKRFDYATADADHFKRIAALGESTTSKFRIGIDLFDLTSYGSRLKKELAKGTSNFTSRVRLGSEVADSINLPPTFEFIYGAFPIELVEAKKATRRVAKRENIAPKVTIKAAEKEYKNEVNEDSTPKEVDLIYKKLKLASRQVNSDQLNILSNLLDSNSFNQSVENLFHFSFLIKEGKLSIEESEGRPICKIVKKTNQQNQGSQEQPVPEEKQDKSQSILSFNMSDYRKWIADMDTE